MRLLLALLLAGCVPLPDPTGAPCPCGAGYECCPTVQANQCVERGHLERCEGAKSCLLPDGTPATLSLSQGFPDTTQSIPLDASGDILLFYGFQGGFHVYTQMTLTRFYPNDVKATRTLFDKATGIQLRDAQHDVLSFVCDGDKWVLLTGQLMYVCPATPPGVVTMHDRELELQIDLESQGTGQKLSQRFTIRPQCNPADTAVNYQKCLTSPQGCGGQGP